MEGDPEGGGSKVGSSVFCSAPGSEGWAEDPAARTETSEGQLVPRPPPAAPATLPNFLRPRDRTPRARGPTRNSEYDRRRPPPRQSIVVETPYARRRAPGSAPSMLPVAHDRAPVRWRFITAPSAPASAGMACRMLQQQQQLGGTVNSLTGCTSPGTLFSATGATQPSLLGSAGMEPPEPSTAPLELTGPSPPEPVGAAALLAMAVQPMRIEPAAAQAPLNVQIPPVGAQGAAPPVRYTHHLHPGKYGRAVLNSSLTHPLPRVVGFAQGSEGAAEDAHASQQSVQPTSGGASASSARSVGSAGSPVQGPADEPVQPTPLAGMQNSGVLGSCANLLGSPRGASIARAALAELCPSPPGLPPWAPREPQRAAADSNAHALAARRCAARSGLRGPVTIAAGRAAAAAAVIALCGAPGLPEGQEASPARHSSSRRPMVRFHVPPSPHRTSRGAAVAPERQQQRGGSARATPPQTKLTPSPQRIHSLPPLAAVRCQSATNLSDAQEAGPLSAPVQRSPRSGPSGSSPGGHSLAPSPSQLQQQQDVAVAPPVGDDDPLNARMRELFEDLQQTWRELAQDPEATLRDLSQGEVLFSLKKNYLKRHPLVRARLADALPYELQHSATTVVGPDGTTHIVNVENKDADGQRTQVEEQEAAREVRARERKRGVRDGRRGGDMHTRMRYARWWLPCKLWGQRQHERRRPEREISLRQLLAEHAAQVSREARAAAAAQRVPVHEDATRLELNALGGLVPLTQQETERIEMLLEAQRDAVRYMRDKGAITA
eukprot:TRINITY_DN14183_c0_g1_i1.p1 TRINITY_DN14183_c0_g1~~TRINITY_DN14183_c0_g1_i1.p1  ORF type:complete len:807 (+),score=206.05 TRINITY_DN14183_c0_g1_i1:93-2423(+)